MVAKTSVPPLTYASVMCHNTAHACSFKCLPSSG